VTYLHAVRRQRRLTQVQLAERAAVPRRIIGLIERGRVNPAADELERLALALNVSPPHALLRAVSFVVPDPNAGHFVIVEAPK
jgi:transcriptional regulator with XRE-family HTH domain